MTITPDKSALEKARERLEASMRLPTYPRAAVDGMKVDASYVASADLRLVLDALAEAERPRHEIAFAYSMKHGWPICGKCGLVIHDGSPYCADRLPSIDTRDSAKDSQ